MFQLLGDSRSKIPFYTLSIYFSVALIFCQVCFYIYSLTNLIRVTDEPIPIPRRRGPFHYRPEEPRESSEFLRAWNQALQSFQDVEEFETFLIPSEMLYERTFSGGEGSFAVRRSSSQDFREQTFESFPVQREVLTDRMSSARGRSPVRRERFQDSHDQTLRSFLVPNEVFSARTPSERGRPFLRRGGAPPHSQGQTLHSFSALHGVSSERTSSARGRSCVCRGRSFQESHGRTLEAFSHSHEVFTETTSSRGRSSVHRGRSPQGLQKQKFTVPCEVFTERMTSARDRSPVPRGRSLRSPQDQTLQSSISHEVSRERQSYASGRSTASRGRSPRDTYEQELQPFSVSHEEFSPRPSSARQRSSVERARSFQNLRGQTFSNYHEVFHVRTSSTRESSSIRTVRLSPDSPERNFHSHSLSSEGFGERTPSTRCLSNLPLGRGRSSRSISQDSSPFPQSSAFASQSHRPTRCRQHSVRSPQFMERSRLYRVVPEVMSERPMQNVQISNRRTSVFERLEPINVRSDPVSDLVRERRALLRERRALLRESKALYEEISRFNM